MLKISIHALTDENEPNGVVSMLLYLESEINKQKNTLC